MCLGRLYVIGLLEGAMMGLGKNLLISTRVPNLQFLTFWPVFLSRTKSSISCFCEKWAAHFAKRNTKFGGGESEGGQKFLPSNPLPFCPPAGNPQRIFRAAGPQIGWWVGSDTFFNSSISIICPCFRFSFVILSISRS